MSAWGIRAYFSTSYFRISCGSLHSMPGLAGSWSLQGEESRTRAHVHGHHDGLDGRRGEAREGRWSTPRARSLRYGKDCIR